MKENLLGAEHFWKNLQGESLAKEMPVQDALGSAQAACKPEAGRW